MSQGLKLLIGAGGIYASFLTYGKLHEQIFKYQSPDGEKFVFAFFLQAIEAFANVLAAGIGMRIVGRQKGLPLHLFISAGVSQVLAKACTSLALANALSFPVVTLAKSGKMVPVMIGSIILGGKSYSVKQYLTVAAIIVGTVIVTMDQKKNGKAGEENSVWGVLFILTSLVLDGVVGGMQTDIQKESKKRLGAPVAQFDMMFWTNVFMTMTAVAICCLPLDASLNMVQPEFMRGLAFCLRNPIIYTKILLFAGCSAVGQSFIFFTIANFDSLTTTTITTTRKVLSTLLSIFTEGHSISGVGWGGLSVASLGICMEIVEKVGGGQARDDKLKSPKAI